jgi:hypothetical protein
MDIATNEKKVKRKIRSRILPEDFNKDLKS